MDKHPNKFLLNGKMFDCQNGIYYPSEDSYLLAKNVKITKGIAIDVGCGSGIQTLNALMQGADKAVAIDVNENALLCTLENAKKIGAEKKVTTLKSDLFENYAGEKADTIIFNPPYVPSDLDEAGEGSKKIKFVDLDGGKNGREVLDRFLAQFPRHLKKNGTCYFLQSDINGYQKTEKKLAQKGLKFTRLSPRRQFFEELAVYKCAFQ
ncbi:MAG: methyltransferase [archaeon]|nr:methyltransferase [archaeon]